MRGMRGPRPVTTTEADQNPAAPGTPDRGRRPWLLMVALCVAQFMVILDATVVNVALPSIARSLGFPAGGLQWVVTAYVLASGGLVLVGGRAADVAGRRRIFLAGLALFTAASLASGLAPAAGALIAARAGQGLGAALLTPAALSIITTSYAGARRAAALGVWGAIGGAGAAAGALAGGILTTWLGWRSVFLVNVPVGVVAGVLSLRLAPRHRPRRRFARELDLPGAALAVAGLVMLAYTLAGAPAHGWGSARTLLPLGLALAVLAGFAAAERPARRPLVPAELWRARSLVAGALAVFGATGILVGGVLTTPAVAYLTRAKVPIPLGILMTAGAGCLQGIFTGVMRARYQVPTFITTLALFTGLKGGALLLTGVSARSGYLTGFLPGLLVVGMGAGLVFAATAVTAMSDIADDRAGLACGLMTTAHEIGAALGVAAFSAVAVAAGGGIAAGYRHGFMVAAAVAAGLAVVAAVAVPAVRPAAGARVAVR